jgi:hypothetical protein
MTSGFRPGDKGWHGQNRARDYSNGGGPTPEMMGFARTVAASIGKSLLELIYTPLGWGIKNGGRVGSFGAAVDRDHYDHVHLALARGGKFGGPEHRFVGSFKDGGVVPATGMAMVHEGETVIPKGQVFEIYLDGERIIDERVEVRLREGDRAAAQVLMAGGLR